MTRWVLLIACSNIAFAQNPLHDLLRDEWQSRLKESPSLAVSAGDRTAMARWGDPSIAGEKRRAAVYEAFLKRLTQIDRNSLSQADQLNYDLFKHTLEDQLADFREYSYVIPLNQREGIQFAQETLRRSSPRTEQDFDSTVARLRAFPAYMDATIGLLEEGIRLKIVHARIIADRLPKQVEVHIVEDPEKSPFYGPFVRMPETISPTASDRLRQQARDAIRQSVVPSYRKFHRFLVERYLPACYEKPGIWQAPDGKRLYEHYVRSFTTTSDLTPEKVHEIGQREVRRIRDEMQTLLAKIGFKGTLQDFFKFLRSDSRFYYKTPEELLDAYRVVAKRIDPELVKVFRLLPRTPYGVLPIPQEIAPDTTAAYYSRPALDGSRAGTYFVNLYMPEARPKYEMMALSMHEAVPGHHLQLAIAQEMGEVPPFRRMMESTAFVEGWALYAESLGDEMGLYDDPYAKFGHLTYDMWRAVRLVVDTGIHYYKWDRQKAIDFFLDNAAKTELDVVNEIDRYIAWPGQALAYKIGQLKIQELRRKSEQKLGSRFDLREFHEVVVSAGSLPLAILERRVDDWLSRKAQGLADR